MRSHWWYPCSLFLILGLILLTHPVNAIAQDEDPDSKAYTSYTLTMQKYKKYVAAMVNIGKAGQSNPKLKNALEVLGDSNIDESVTYLNGIPELQRSIASAGLTTRDFVLILGASLQAEMANYMIKEQKVSRDAALKEMGASPAQLDFVQKNEAEIARLKKEAEAQNPSLKDRNEEETGAAQSE